MEKDLEILTKEAEAGRVESMVALGEYYKDKDGTENSRRAAMKWFRQAADLGSGDACYDLSELERTIAGEKKWLDKGMALGNDSCILELANLYMRGRLGLQNMKKALPLLEKAADGQGRTASIAARTLGDIYNGFGYEGFRVPKDRKKSLQYYERSYALGNEDAGLSAAQLYLTVPGTGENRARGIALFQKLADQGEHQAAIKLAILYMAGEVVPKNFLKAMELLNRVIYEGGYGVDKAKDLQEEIRRRISTGGGIGK